MAKRILIILFGLLLVLACVFGQAAAQDTTDNNQVAKDGAKPPEPEPKAKEQPKDVPIVKLPTGNKVPAKGKTGPQKNVGKGKGKGKEAIGNGKTLKNPATLPTITNSTVPDNSTSTTNPTASANSTTVPIVPESN